MSSTTYFPRPEQIDELTRGFDLPLASLHEEHLALIAEVLALAWTDLTLTRQEVLATGTEAEINALMETRLSRLLDEHPIWGQLVRSVVRGRETVSFDGAHLEKRPDLSIHLSTRTPSFPLLVECKLIDIVGGKSTALYCNHGLKRFLTGEYGWAIRESFMLAYVRDSSTIASCLTPFLEASRSLRPQPYAIMDLAPAIADRALDLAQTSHYRGFKYPSREPPRDDPGPITIWHLWLQLGVSSLEYSITV
ncbi:hypothetical protein [Bradyrhizobium liaoningense]|uniref:hypothetical protein n=1 Tax=Bradyrhizobium liaoningense TaxID=43992 RepID=UPI001BAA7565|nr:hypothetical protein [Bradyrhizobium liaoningense]MBR0860206.1 hypothetical protein [Bradyrhizobium liaoningense]